MNENEPTSEQFIGETAKNISEMIRVTLMEWRGRAYIDIRVVEDETGRKTHKGITVLPAVCKALLPIMSEAIEACERKGQ
jgi:hypothetical protein